jgi:predicted RecA/RadA family phage recombinase
MQSKRAHARDIRKGRDIYWQSNVTRTCQAASDQGLECECVHSVPALLSPIKCNLAAAIKLGYGMDP